MPLRHTPVQVIQLLEHTQTGSNGALRGVFVADGVAETDHEFAAGRWQYCSVITLDERLELIVDHRGDVVQIFGIKLRWHFVGIEHLPSAV